MEYWPRLALSAYVKEHGIDLEDSGETENGVDTCKRNECSVKTEQDIASSNNSKVNSTSDSSDVSEKCDTQVEKGMNTCDTASTVPDNECKSACENQIEEVENSEKRTPSSKEKESIKEGSRELMLFNEDIVCEHNLRSPTAMFSKITEKLAEEIMGLCSDAIHPATFQKDFDICQQCGVSTVPECLTVCSQKSSKIQ